MNDVFQVFLLAAVEDQYRQYSTGKFRLQENFCSQIEQELNNNPPETKVNRKSISNIQNSHITEECWAIRTNQITGKRTGRQFTIAISYDQQFTSEELNHAIEESGGILEICKDFYVSTTDSKSVDLWLAKFPSKIIFILLQQERKNKHSITISDTSSIDSGQPLKTHSSSSNESSRKSPKKLTLRKIFMSLLQLGKEQKNPGITLLEQEKSPYENQSLSIYIQINIILLLQIFTIFAVIYFSKI
jgi:hypothetical protein